MALTSQQDIPEKPKPSEPWTFRRLFPLSGAVTTLAKVFVNPFDVMLGYLILLIGIAELINRDVSPYFYILTGLIILVDVFERHACDLITPLDKSIKKEPKK